MAGWTHIAAERYEEAVAFERRAMEIEPNTLQGIWMLGMALAGTSAWDEAREWFGRTVSRSAQAPVFLGMLAWCEAASGRKDQARQTLAELERRAATEYVAPLILAFGTSELGDTEKARTLLAAAFAERASVLTLPGIPCMRKLRDEPLMHELVWCFRNSFTATREPVCCDHDVDQSRCTARSRSGSGTTAASPPCRQHAAEGRAACADFSRRGRGASRTISCLKS